MTAFNSDFRLRARDVASAAMLADRLNAILSSLDLRVAGVEEQSASIGAMEAALRAYGTDRINEVLGPVVDTIRSAAGLGALLTTTSWTAMEVGLGPRELTIASPAAAAFAPAAHLSIVAVDDTDAAMLARCVSWDATAGLLTVEVIASSGTGAHDVWTISAAAAVENSGQVRTGAVGELVGTTLAAQLEEIAAALADRQPKALTLTALADVDLVGDRAIITDAAGAPALTPLSATGRALLGAADRMAARTAIDAVPVTSAQLLGEPTAPTAPVTTDSNRIVNVAALRSALAASEAATTSSLAGKQPVDATLTALAAVVTAADKLIYSTGADAFATTTLTAHARSLLAAVDAAAARTVMGAASDTATASSLAGKQPVDATLTALAAVVTAADKLIYSTGADTFATTTLTAHARSLLAAVDAAAARTVISALGTGPAPFLTSFPTEDAHQDLPSGWYTVTPTTANIPVSGGVLIVFQRGADGGRQQHLYSALGRLWTEVGTVAAGVWTWSGWTEVATASSLRDLLAATSAVGSIGSTAWLAYAAPPASAVAAGTTVAGSGLRYAAGGGAVSGTPSGTWRLLGAIPASATGGNVASLWERVA